METGTGTVNDAIRWQLKGIEKERQEIQARLSYIDEQEKTLRAQGLTGTGGTAQPTRQRTSGKSTSKAASGKRSPSPEQRKKMSDSAKQRWAERKKAAAATNATAQATEESAPYAPPVETASGESATA